MSRCGCADLCTCVLTAGRGTSLSGFGTRSRPITIDMIGGESYLRGASTDSIQVTVTGTGTETDPYEVAMEVIADAPEAVIVNFLTPGSYVYQRPAFGSLAICTILGAGGGGAGGQYKNGITTAHVARGGDGGELVLASIALADLDAEIPVVVGLGGGGGPRGIGAVGALGGQGTPGGPSSFDGLMAAGGAGGDPDASQRTPSGVRQGGDGAISSAAVVPTPNGIAGGGAYPWSAAPSTPSDGTPSGLSLAPAGSGGGGGVGSRQIAFGGFTAAGNGYAGSTGAGGGGAGAGTVGDRVGGRGGDGAVQIVIQ